jgi:hypothetical protein
MPADDVDFAHTGFQAIRKIRPAQAASDYIRNARLPTTTSTATEQLPMDYPTRTRRGRRAPFTNERANYQFMRAAYEK